jgi:hypothetical protein
MKKKVIKTVANIAKCGVGAFTVLGLSGCEDDNISRKCSDDYIKYAPPSLVEECKDYYGRRVSTESNTNGGHSSGVPSWFLMYMAMNNNSTVSRSSGYFSSPTHYSTGGSHTSSGGSSHGSSSGG